MSEGLDCSVTEPQHCESGWHSQLQAPGTGQSRKYRRPMPKDIKGQRLWWVWGLSQLKYLNFEPENLLSIVILSLTGSITPDTPFVSALWCPHWQNYEELTSWFPRSCLVLNFCDSGTSENLLRFQIPKVPSNKKISKTPSPTIYPPRGDTRLNGTFHRTVSLEVL